MAYTQILLIDDDEDDHEIFMAALSQVCGGLECTALADAREAFAKLLVNELQPEIIFLDLNMAGMSGEEFLSKIKGQETLRHIPVIIYSTTSNTQIIQFVMEKGATEFITKPDRFDTLVKILKPIVG